MLKKRLPPILFSGILLAAALLWRTAPGLVSLILYIAAYLLVGAPVLWRAGRGILRGQFFDENFLMTVATISAFAVREYPEAVAVMLFYQVGELFQDYAVGKSRRSIGALMDIRPEHAYRLLADGSVEEVSPSTIAVDEHIVVRPGDRVPLDGIVLEGTSALDTAALTGESLPRDVAPGDEILSGCINCGGVLTVRVTKEFSASTVSKILDMVENAGNRKAQTEHFISRFAAIYTPTVVGAALLLALLPPLLLQQPFTVWIYRACTFLVVSCPCALVISIPLTFFGGIGGASRAGILIKGGNYLEALAKTEIAVFDKTGTLTEGHFRVQAVHPQGMSADDLLRLAATAEYHSEHPIAVSLKAACKTPLSPAALQEVHEVTGHGVQATVDGQTVLVGNRQLMTDSGITAPEQKAAGTIVYVAVDHTFAGTIHIADTVKADAADTLRRLHMQGVRRTVMLTGDNAAAAQAVADTLPIDDVYSELLPGDKVEKVEALLRETSPRGKLLFVGDGINDAPVLARADIGVAMGGLGADAAIEAADVVIMTDEPSKLGTAIAIARKTHRIVTENIIFALTVKALVLVCGALGFVNMWAAVFADVGVAVIAIINALRMLHVKWNT